MSNTGFKGPGTARLRMFCQLNREHALEGLHGWSKAAKIVGVPIDPSVLQPHQPIYTARPLFDGLHDPVAAELRASSLPARPATASISSTTASPPGQPPSCASCAMHAAKDRSSP